jgi:hypothetical protein
MQSSSAGDTLVGATRVKRAGRTETLSSPSRVAASSFLPALSSRLRVINSDRIGRLASSALSGARIHTFAGKS